MAFHRPGVFVVVLSLLVVVCGPSQEQLASVDYRPQELEGWEVSIPEEVGLDPDLVASLYLEAADLERLYSVLIIKDGYLIAEDYFNEGSLEQKTNTMSVTKSFVSALPETPEMLSGPVFEGPREGALVGETGEKRDFR